MLAAVLAEHAGNILGYVFYGYMYTLTACFKMKHLTTGSLVVMVFFILTDIFYVNLMKL